MGAGGIGEIHLARAVGSGGRLVAVKQLLPQTAVDPIFVGMFIDEARIASVLRHPNVATVYEFGEQKGTYFIAMEWIDGVSLRELLTRATERGVELPLGLTARIVADVAAALDYAWHSPDGQGRPQHIIHRDVSPPNVMVGLDGTVKLLDFGMAKARSQLQKTEPGFVKGKFGYLSPEQLAGDADPRTDVFALGLCFWECLVGERYFKGTTAAETVLHIQAYKKAPAVRDLRPDVPERVSRLLQGAMAPKPNHRPTAGELRRYLEECIPLPGRDQVGRFVRELFPERQPEDPGPHDPRRSSIELILDVLRDESQRKKWLVALAIATGLLAGILSAVLLGV